MVRSRHLLDSFMKETERLVVASINKGFSLGGESVVNATLEVRDRGRSNRAGVMGDIQYPGSECLDGNGNTVSCGSLSGPRTLSDSNVNDPERTFDRSRFRIGDADSTHVSFVLNMKGPVDFMDGEIYSFLDLSTRENESGGFYRRANALSQNPAGSDYPDGFLPLIKTQVNDYAFGAGFEGDLTDSVKMDASYVVGGNTFSFEITDSHNASWIRCHTGEAQQCLSDADYTGSIPLSAEAGELKLFQHTVNLDFTTPFTFGNFAWGGEYRREEYEIEAGERYSYEDYDGPAGAGVGGIQVFPGFKPSNEVSETRDAFSAYADAEFDVGEMLLLSPAVRYENYSDFGNTFNGKLSARAALSDSFSLRGSASTGFRAPSMQQIYFNNISTQFNANDQGVLVPSQTGTFRNDGDVAKALGVPELKEETSRNFSAGFVFNPVPSLTITTDFYYILIDDRVILSGRIGDDKVAVVSQSIKDRLVSAGAEEAQFFMNAADTTTKGVDIVASFDHSFADSSTLEIVLAGTVSETEITDVNLPLDLPEELFTPQDQSILEEWQPKDRFSLSGTYSKGFASLLVAVHRYGEYTVLDGGERQTYGAKYLTDANLSLDLGKVGTFKIGANNLFDVKPDKNKIGQSRSGTIYDHDGSLIVDSPGVFTYSRRSAPFGFNGGYYYVAYEYSF